MERKFSYYYYWCDQNDKDSEDYKIPVNLGVSMWTRTPMKKGPRRDKYEARYKRLGFDGLLKSLDDYGFSIIIYIGEKQFSLDLDWRRV